MKDATNLVAARRALVIARAAALAHSHDRTAIFDARWSELAVALATLRERGCRAIRIVDADCGSGTLLLEAVRHARRLGFTAIEGRGIDACAASIAHARSCAGRLRDPAIGLTFERADALAALAEETDLPADIVLWHAAPPDVRPGLAEALARAGRVVIGDPVATSWRRAA